MASDHDLDKPSQILGVDDDPSDLMLMQRILGRDGYLVRCAPNCERALLILQDITPAVLILDVAMPGMTGFGLCSTLKRVDRLKSVPVIFVSGLNSMDSFRASREVGGVFFVPKAKGWGNLLSAVALLCRSQGRPASRYDSSGAGARFPEKRSASRYAFSAGVDVTEPIQGMRFTGRTCDISLTGCRAELSSSLSRGSLVRVCIAHNGQRFESIATVIRTQQEGLAVAFRETSPGQKAIIARWIAEMGAEQSV